MLQVYFPLTRSYTAPATPSPTITANATIIYYHITYEDTVEISSSTVFDPVPTITGNNTNDDHNAYITENTFTWKPVPGTVLTGTSGSTYIAYIDIFGGVKEVYTPAATKYPYFEDGDPTCIDTATEITNLYPTKSKDWDAFIQTIVGGELPASTDGPLPLPPPLVQYLQAMPDITESFGTHQLASCTLGSSTLRIPHYEYSSIYATETKTATKTFIETSYTDSVIYTQGKGCLRKENCGGSNTIPTPGPNDPPEKPEKYKEPQRIEDPPKDPPKNEDPKNPEEPPKPGDPPKPEDPSKPHDPPKDGLSPEQWVSAILGNPGQFLENPTAGPAAATNPGQSITVGGVVMPVQPLPSSPQNPQDVQPPGVVIGSQTLAPGQSATINGVVVSVPAGGVGSSVVVGGSTFAVNPVVNPAPGPTAPAVLTVGSNVVTANSNGQFIVGTQTLKPGGPAIIVSGTLLSLGPSGTVAVVNGATQVLGNAPLITAAPALTVNGKVISATVIGGTTEFVIAPGQTLTPGGSLVVSGTTFALPAAASGSSVVINGVTQAIANTPGVPALTVNGKVIPATVNGGKTEFVIAPGQTLTPGGQLVVSGTTFSLPAGASGSSVVINGVTQSVGKAPSLPVLSLNGQSISATVVGGTTAFVVAPGQTLTPGGSLVVSGTTLSMPATGSGSVVVVNGVTSTLGNDGSITAAPALTVNGKTFSASVVDGTTQYSLGPGTTLKPGEAVTISGTTFSLDPSGTALVVNGKTSSIPKTPASNTASTTGSAKKSSSSGSKSKSKSSTTTQRAPGNFIASGIGITSKKKADAPAIRPGGLDLWAEGMVIGLAGWLLMLL